MPVFYPHAAGNDCELLNSPVHGSVNQSEGLSHGAISRYSCDQGHQLYGHKERRCDDGQWLGSQPSCAGMVCAQ